MQPRLLTSPTPAVRLPAPSSSGKTGCLSAPAAVGNYVRLRKAGTGFVRYLGPVEDKGGLWYGVELDEPRGMHDGCPFRQYGDARHQFADTRCGRRYFRCRHKHGLLVRRAAIVEVLPGGGWVASPRVAHHFRAAAHAPVPCGSPLARGDAQRAPATAPTRARRAVVRTVPSTATPAPSTPHRGGSALPNVDSGVGSAVARGGFAARVGAGASSGPSSSAVATAMVMSPARAETLRRGVHQLSMARRTLDGCAAAPAGAGNVEKAAEQLGRARLLITRCRLSTATTALPSGGVMAQLEALEAELALRRRICVAKQAADTPQPVRTSPQRSPLAWRAKQAAVNAAARTPPAREDGGASERESWCTRALDSVHMVEMRRTFDVSSLEVSEAHLRVAQEGPPAEPAQHDQALPASPEAASEPMQATAADPKQPEGATTPAPAAPAAPPSPTAHRAPAAPPAPPAPPETAPAHDCAAAAGSVAASRQTHAAEKRSSASSQRRSQAKLALAERAQRWQQLAHPSTAAGDDDE